MNAIKIKVFGENKFLMLGVETIIQKKFDVKGGRFINENSDHFTRDLVILIGLKYHFISPCNHFNNSSFIFVGDKGGSMLRRKSVCENTLGELVINGTLEKFIFTMEELIDKNLKFETKRVCLSCKPNFTNQERNILRGISMGLDLGELATVLKIHRKTASAHKRNAMRKIGVRCNKELCDWLMLNGEKL